LGKRRRKTKIPDQWNKPLRELFLDTGISDTAPTNNEYSKQLESLIEEEQKKHNQ